MGIQIFLPPDLEAKIESEAHACGMSPSDFVRSAVERVISRTPSTDPLFADTAVYRDNGPEDFAANHDDYLYGDRS